MKDLSEKENALYERFKTEKSIEISSMSEPEKGALGKLAARKLVEKNSVPVNEAGKLKTVWVLRECSQTEENV